MNKMNRTEAATLGGCVHHTHGNIRVNALGRARLLPSRATSE